MGSRQEQLRTSVTLLLLAAILLMAGCSRTAAGQITAAPPTGAALRGVALKDVRPAGDFTLTDHLGQPFHMHETQGKVVALFFGYSHCPDVCPLTLTVMGRAAAVLGEDAEQVRFLFVTVDPDRDTADRLGDYLSGFDQVDVTGLTGSQDQLAPVYAEYQVAIEKVTRQNGAYSVNHSSLIWLIDQSGMIRSYLPMGMSGEDLANDVRYLLKDPPAEIRDAWVRPAAAGEVTAGYFTLLNPTDAPIRLTGVESDWGDASLHQTVADKGGAMAKMKPVSAVDIPAGGQVAFAPGGYHVMIENLKRDLNPGEEVVLRIRLADGTSLTASAQVGDRPGGHNH